jgi:hypothetical protein
MVSLPGFPVNTRRHPRVQALRMLISTGKKASVYWKYDARRRHPALPVDKQDFGMSCFCKPAQATGMLPHHGTQYQGIRCDLRSQPALGLGALGLGRCSQPLVRVPALGGSGPCWKATDGEVPLIGSRLFCLRVEPSLDLIKVAKMYQAVLIPYDKADRHCAVARGRI